MLANILLGIVIALIALVIGYSCAEWKYKEEISKLNDQLNTVIKRYNEDVNDVKELNESLRSVNRKLKTDITSLKSDKIELELKLRQRDLKVNDTDNSKHVQKKRWRPNKK